jgi:hypothetical protein
LGKDEQILKNKINLIVIVFLLAIVGGWCVSDGEAFSFFGFLSICSFFWYFILVIRKILFKKSIQLLGHFSLIPGLAFVFYLHYHNEFGLISFTISTATAWVLLIICMPLGIFGGLYLIFLLSDRKKKQSRLEKK